MQLNQQVEDLVGAVVRDRPIPLARDVQGAQVGQEGVDRELFLVRLIRVALETPLQLVHPKETTEETLLLRLTQIFPVLEEVLVVLALRNQERQGRELRLLYLDYLQHILQVGVLMLLPQALTQVMVVVGGPVQAAPV